MTSPTDSPGPGPSRGTAPDERPVAEGMAALANLGWQLLLTMGIATIALGVIALVWPGATLRVVGILHFITGAASTLLGLICFRGTLESLLLLALWIGFSWLLRGTLETAAAASAPAMPGRGWHVAFGIIGALAGIVMIVMPFASIATLTLVVGVMAIIVVLTEVVRAIRTRVEIGHLASGTATQRRPLFHVRPHPQH
ncbi:HdeD family acid-resistance protein [Streptomyces rhizosphaericus]|uniref:HdeD family acid-resistance protein n=1 Tax=Streptomyces rhizosphaericus TaxID=114699 RepID=A0A6G4AEV0_9ACTN|nr:DUF308 domain-containing protein [Streptomyces rhizosphaericus]NEW71017.1 HdeD family acid-resistance protein [Streptomyces rhizosphaericus]